MILAGDIGGTHTRLALFEKGKKIVEKKYPSKKYPGLEPIVQEFLKKEQAHVSKACFGIAGPIRHGIGRTMNLPWIVDGVSLKKILSIPLVRILNDLEANAYGLKLLKKEEFFPLQEGDPHAIGNQALIAAGTGLGEAGLFWDGHEHHPFVCEGGHSDFAPKNEGEMAFFTYLAKRIGHVSYERVVSGPGLYSVFQFLVETGRSPFSPSVKEEMERRDPALVISDWGSKGKDPTCALALDWFLSAYGAEAGNLALKFLSLGGLYIGGGIAPHIVDALKKGPFLVSFLEKGRLKALLETIPVRISLNEDTALLGAADCAERL